MKLKEYFESMKGRGILATADAEGLVDAAVYARPHVMDEETLAFIMLDRLTRHNLKANPHAAYLFMEEGDKYSGKRFFLTKLKEEQDAEKINRLRRRKYPDVKEKEEYLVYFRVNKVLPLVGAGEG
jgi:hypothetical protein